MIFNFFRNGKKPDFWEIRESFIEYVESESDVLEVCDFSQERFGGVFIGYNPDTRERPGSFLSAGINHLGDNPEDAKLDRVILSAYWTAFPATQFVDSHYLQLEPKRKKIEEVLGFDKLDFRVDNAYKIGVSKNFIDLTDPEHIHDHFKWLRKNLEKLYWMIRLFEKGVI